MASLTGDPELDRLIPSAVRLACGLREWRPEEVAAALDEAAAIAGPDAFRALAVLLAAMLPWDRSPADLLAWVSRRSEFEYLREVGVDAATAATLLDRPSTPRARR